MRTHGHREGIITHWGLLRGANKIMIELAIMENQWEP